MAGCTSLPSYSDDSRQEQVVDPYQAILSLIRRQQEGADAPPSGQTDGAFREIVELTVKLFAEYAERHGGPPLPGGHTVTATEAAIVSTHLLRSVDIALFELAMWQSWSGAADIDDMRVDSRARRSTNA